MVKGKKPRSKWRKLNDKNRKSTVRKKQGRGKNKKTRRNKGKRSISVSQNAMADWRAKWQAYKHPTTLSQATKSKKSRKTAGRKGKMGRRRLNKVDR